MVNFLYFKFKFPCDGGKTLLKKRSDKDRIRLEHGFDPTLNSLFKPDYKGLLSDIDLDWDAGRIAFSMVNPKGRLHLFENMYEPDGGEGGAGILEKHVIRTVRRWRVRLRARVSYTRAPSTKLFLRFR